MVNAMLDRGRASTFKLEPRVELLVRACRALELPVAGPAEGEDYAYPLSPSTEQLLAYLTSTMPNDTELARRVQGAVLQYQGALRAMEEAEMHLLGGTLSDEHLDALRHALFFMSRFGEQFRQDPMLAQVFPQPQTVQATVAAAPTAQATPEPPRPLTPPRPPAPPQPAPISAAGAGNDPLVGKLERLLAYLAPKMETVRLINALFDPTQIGKVGDLMAPAARTARTLGSTIKKQNRALMGTLQEAYALFVQLNRDLRLYQSQGFNDAGRQSYFRLRVLTMNFFKEPLVREIFPPSDKAKLGDA